MSAGLQALPHALRLQLVPACHKRLVLLLPLVLALVVQGEHARSERLEEGRVPAIRQRARLFFVPEARQGVDPHVAIVNVTQLGLAEARRPVSALPTRPGRVAPTPAGGNADAWQRCAWRATP